MTRAQAERYVRSCEENDGPDSYEEAAEDVTMTLHIVDRNNIYRARCGIVLSRQAGDPFGHWWWEDCGHHATRADVPPSVAAVARRDGLTVCPDCAREVSSDTGPCVHDPPETTGRAAT